MSDATTPHWDVNAEMHDLRAAELARFNLQRTAYVSPAIARESLIASSMRIHQIAAIRRVMHCDLDCFFAAVEEMDDPSLRGKPVVVGGDPDRRGVVSTANYAARRFGVHSALSAAHARRLCPHAIFLRPRFERYKELSQHVMAILEDYFLVLEQVSVDEAYGELAPSAPGCVPAEDTGREIKRRVRAETGLVISVGAGRTKSLAKLASDHSKPDGLLVIKPGAERAFLAPLPIGMLHGVGPHTRERLERQAITTVGQLAALDAREVALHMSKHGIWLWQIANGQDDRPVVADHGPPKSISKEDTYARDIGDIERASERVRDLAAPGGGTRRGERRQRAHRDAEGEVG